MSALSEPYEVFVVPRRGEPARHVGSVMAPEPVLALHQAKEVYTRRQDCVCVWVVPRRAIVMFSPEDEVLFQVAYAKDYRQPGYFGRPRDSGEREGRDRSHGSA